MRTDPETLQAILGAKGKRDAEREREDIVRDDVERGAEMLPALSAQHAAARAGEAVGDLERGDERHDLAHESDDRFVVAEEIAVDLGDWGWGVRGRDWGGGGRETHVFGGQEGEHDDYSR